MSSWVEYPADYSQHPSYDPSSVPPAEATDGTVFPPRTSASQSYYGSRRSFTNSRQDAAPSRPIPPLPPPPPPVAPIAGIPTPAPGVRGPSDVDHDAEWMTVYPGFDDPQATDVEQYGSPENRPRGGKTRFVGGFVAGLRRLPRAMARNFLQDRQDRRPPPSGFGRQPEQGATDLPDMEYMESSAEIAPPYDSPGQTVEPESVHYVEGIEMPEAQHLSIHASPSPRATLRSPRHSTGFPSYHSSPPRTVRNPDPSRSRSSGETVSGHAPPSHAGTNPASPNPEGDIPLRAQHNVTIQSPEFVEPKLGPDYQRMTSPVRAPSEASFPSQLARVQQFFKDLRDLPWISNHITVDYVPAETSRSRYRARHPPGPWYTPRHRNLDLLAGGSSTRFLAAGSGQSLPSHPIHASSATLAQQPSHGHGSAEALYGPPQQPASYGQGIYAYPVPPIFVSPQPVFLYTAPSQHIASPRGNPENINAPPQATNHVSPEMQQPGYGPPGGMYQYMVAVPPPPFVQSPEFAHGPPPHAYHPQYPVRM